MVAVVVMVVCNQYNFNIPIIKKLIFVLGQCPPCPCMNGNPPQANESPAQPNASPAANTNTQPATTAAAPTPAATTACPVPTCDANAKAVNTTKCDVCKLVLQKVPSEGL